MTLEALKQDIIDCIVESTETACEISQKTYLIRDLGLSSVEIVVLLSDLEDRFGINIPSSRLRYVQTVGDLTDVVIAILSE